MVARLLTAVVRRVLQDQVLAEVCRQVLLVLSIAAEVLAVHHVDKASEVFSSY